MSRNREYRWLQRAATIGGLVMVMTAAAPNEARAHCDTMDGPVVKAGQAALESGSPTLALIWVRPQDEPEILSAFRHALAVRQLGVDARELADRFFLETLVRIHRQGEGEPFTGIKPAGTDPGPVIPLVDRVVERRTIDELESHLMGLVRRALHDRFERVVATDGFSATDVAAGREHVAAYVALTHYVEALHRLVAGVTTHQGHDEPPGSSR